MGFTPPEQRARPTNSPQSSASLSRRVLAIECLALTLFAFGLFDDSFVDEYAYISQSYYADLFFEGKFNHPAWLDLYAFDLQPVPKYLIGPSLRLAHLRIPSSADADALVSPLQAIRQPGDLDRRSNPVPVPGCASDVSRCSAAASWSKIAASVRSARPC